eukprot:CAMPEP_0169450736 /NCGR_PEP_ID=MMETSP1042-20121227/13315_1 /TAXON_ID=464988 /ORGANISM="Hemiselmis andersenii, Strain CCMP1180" /LENGTH=463 /DNA_ID=CAMNT_0009562585 /DNA_START=61 /DNA_END=1449 /DNA_ORIENTATION=-
MVGVDLKDLKPDAYLKYALMEPKKRSVNIKRIEDDSELPQTFVAEKEMSPLDFALQAFAESKAAFKDLHLSLGTDQFHEHTVKVVNVGLKPLLLPSSSAESPLGRFGRQCFAEVKIVGNRVTSATLRHALHGSALLDYLANFISKYEHSTGFDAGGDILLRAFAAMDEATESEKNHRYWVHVEEFRNSFGLCFVQPKTETALGEGALWQVLEISDADHRKKSTAEGRQPPPNSVQAPPPTSEGQAPAVRQKQKIALQVPKERGADCGAPGAAASAGAGAGGGGARAAVGEESAEDARRRLEKDCEKKKRQAEKQKEDKLKEEHQMRSGPLQEAIQKECETIMKEGAIKTKVSTQERKNQEMIDASMEKRKAAQQEHTKETQRMNYLAKQLQECKDKIAASVKTISEEQEKIVEGENAKEAFKQATEQSDKRIAECESRKKALEEKLQKVDEFLTPQRNHGVSE